MTAWAHRLEPLAPEGGACSRRCPNRAAFRLSYLYVARGNHTYSAAQQLCRTHAERSAKRFGLALPRTTT